MKLAQQKKSLAIKMLEKLDPKSKERAWKDEQKNFDRQFYHTVSKPRHERFAKKYPYESKNTPIGDLKGGAKKMYDDQFKSSQKMIGPVQNKLLERAARRQIIKHYKSPLHQRGGIKGFLKSH